MGRRRVLTPVWQHDEHPDAAGYDLPESEPRAKRVLRHVMSLRGLGVPERALRALVEWAQREG